MYDGRPKPEVHNKTMPMVEMQIGDQTIHYDRHATAQIYADVSTGWVERCRCVGCRNFLAQRETIYPRAFTELLDRLGIDPKKEAEAVLDGPLKNGLYHYGGWFFFVGEMLTGGDTWEAVPGTQVKIRRHHEHSEVCDSPYFGFFFTRFGPCPKEFPTVEPRLAIEFEAHVKWILAESWDSDFRPAARCPDPTDSR